MLGNEDALSTYTSVVAVEMLPPHPVSAGVASNVSTPTSGGLESLVSLVSLASKESAASNVSGSTTASDASNASDASFVSGGRAVSGMVVSRESICVSIWMSACASASSGEVGG